MSETTALVPIQQFPNLDELLTGQLSVSSIKQYGADIKAYSAFCTVRGLELVQAQSLIAWRDHLAIDTLLSPNTINRQLASIRRVVREANTRELISNDRAYSFSTVRNVSIRALRERLKPHSRTRIYPEQMRRMCDWPSPHTLVGQRDRAMLHTLASSGLRISELISLTSAQIEQRGQFYVLLVRGKTDIDYRDACLSSEAKAHIDTWMQARPVVSPYIFTQFDGRGDRLTPDPISKQGAWKIITDYAQAAGLQWVKPHDYRRFLGTVLVEKDAIAAQKALGHKSLATTQKYYVLSGLQAGITDNLY